MYIWAICLAVFLSSFSVSLLCMMIILFYTRTTPLYRRVDEPTKHKKNNEYWTKRKNKNIWLSFGIKLDKKNVYETTVSKYRFSVFTVSLRLPFSQHFFLFALRAGRVFFSLLLLLLLLDIASYTFLLISSHCCNTCITYICYVYKVECVSVCLDITWCIIFTNWLYNTST